MSVYDDIRPSQCVRESVVFRSVLEAKWSLAFEMMGLSWEYEPKTFPMPSGRIYTPDFRVGSCWIEIKPTYEALLDVERKLHEFAQTSIPEDARFFSITCDRPNFRWMGRSTVVEWFDEGIRAIPWSQAISALCANVHLYKTDPDLYADYVQKVFDVVMSARFTKPLAIAHLMEGD